MVVGREYITAFSPSLKLTIVNQPVMVITPDLEYYRFLEFLYQ
jgi:hypothetical protein